MSLANFPPNIFSGDSFPYSGVKRFFSYHSLVTLSLSSTVVYFPAAHRSGLPPFRFSCLKGILFLNPTFLLTRPWKLSLIDIESIGKDLLTAQGLPFILLILKGGLV